MDKTALVGMQDRQIEGLVLNALRGANVPVTMLDWEYSPELNELQLVIATSLFDSVGPHEANARVLEALQHAGIYQQMPIRRIFIKSPQDPTVKALQDEMKLKAEGSIHIIANRTVHGVDVYSIFFTPYASPGGVVRSRVVTDTKQLIEFLGRQLEISSHHLASAMLQLHAERNAIISHVQLTLRKARRLGLA